MSDSLSQIKICGFFIIIVGSAFSVSLCGWGLAIYLIAAILTFFLEKKYEWPPFPELAVLITLLISLSVSVFISSYFWTSLQGLGKLLQGFAYLYAALDVIRTKKELRLVITTLTTVFFLAALSGAWQTLFGYDFVYFRKPLTVDLLRVTGPFKHYNDYGAFLVPGFALVIALVIENMKNLKNWKTLFLLLVLFILGYALMHTISRSALLSVFVSLICFGLFFNYRWWFLAALGSAIALLIALPNHFSSRLLELLNAQVSSSGERLLLIKTAFSMILQSPFFGLGLNTYSIYFPQFRPAGYEGLMYAHNSYLQLGAEAGLVGLVLFLFFIVRLLYRSCLVFASAPPHHHRTIGIALVAGSIGILFNALLDSLFQATRLRALFWVILGIAVAIAYQKKRFLEN